MGEGWWWLGQGGPCPRQAPVSTPRSSAGFPIIWENARNAHGMLEQLFFCKVFLHGPACWPPSSPVPPTDRALPPRTLSLVACRQASRDLGLKAPALEDNAPGSEDSACRAPGHASPQADNSPAALHPQASCQPTCTLGPTTARGRTCRQPGYLSSLPSASQQGASCSWWFRP